MSRQKYETTQWMRFKALHEKHPEWKVSDMAKAMHSTYQRIYAMMKWHGYEIDLRVREYAPHFEEDDRKQMARMYVNGKTTTEIAEYFGTSASVVHRWLVKYGVKERSKPNPRFIERDLMIAKMAAEGKRDKDIAKAYGLTEYQVGNYKTRIRRKTTLLYWKDIYLELIEKKKRIYRIINSINETTT